MPDRLTPEQLQEIEKDHTVLHILIPSKTIAAEIKSLTEERDAARQELQTACEHMDGLLMETLPFERESNDEYIAASNYLTKMLEEGKIKRHA